MKRFFYRILSILCIILGIIGALLPVMPTVPFLLAALYFAADEPRIQKFIKSNKYLKKYLDFYLGNQTIPLYGKLTMLGALWLSLSISTLFLTGNLYWQLVPAAITAAVLLHVLRRKK